MQSVYSLYIIRNAQSLPLLKPTSVCIREKEGWPLLTVDTEVNGDSKRTNERCPFLVGSLGLSCLYKRFLFCLSCSVGPVQNIFFLTVQYIISILLSPSPCKLGRQPCWVTCLIVFVSDLYPGKQSVVDFLSIRRIVY